MAETQRVWILGAGFSRSLGAPLLPDLLSMRRWRDLYWKYPSLLGQGKDANEKLAAIVGVYALYHWGRDFPEGSLFGQPPGHRGEKHFEHAEDFLVRLDHMEYEQISNLFNAVSDAIESRSTGLSHERERRAFYHDQLHFGPLGKLTKNQLLDAAKLLLALECEEFVKADWENLEEFTPYKDWAEKLNENDSIVTFNYDRVVELALNGRQLVATERSGDRRGVLVHKLHGSTNWWLDGDDVRVQAEPCTDGEHVPLIAIPGRSKTNDTKRISPVWGSARKKLMAAEEVYIVGYGMPESDAKSRDFILRALRENQNERLKVTIVLGEPGFRSARLEATIKQSLPRRLPPVVPPTRYLEVTTTPQYAQDFLQGWALGYMKKTSG